TRRFQLVQVEEPDGATAVEMLRGIAGKLELHHGVQIMDAAIVDAVKLSHRYISGRQLPDKAISVLDTACSRWRRLSSGGVTSCWPMATRAQAVSSTLIA
ncbi:hypothetical protein ACV373_32195, partial [Pseudomonas aeruginosa]